MAHFSSSSAQDYFKRPWTITTPQHPNIKLIRTYPSHFPAWLPIVINSANNVHMTDVKDKTWDDIAISEWKSHSRSSYIQSLTKFDHLNILILLSSAAKEIVIGYADLFLLSSGRYNIGLVLDAPYHRKGYGKLATKMLIQLAFNIGKDDWVEAGTMKSNLGMRGVMSSLGVSEEEKVVEVEGRGVLAEISYSVRRESWKAVKLDVQWGEGKFEGVEDAK